MIRAPRFSIILAAGKGTRMRSADRHKVCFPIDGVPAINRALEIYNQVGIPRHVVVVGTLAGQVIETVGTAFSNVVFAYQANQSGTADAARVGLNALEGLDPESAVLLTAGDQIVEPNVLERLFDMFAGEELDLGLVASPGLPESDRGRVVEDEDGGLLAVVEYADIRQRQVYRDLRFRAASGELSAKEAGEIIVRGFSPPGETVPEKKYAAAFGDLWTAVKEKRPPAELLPFLRAGKDDFRFLSAGEEKAVRTPEELGRGRWLHTSIYLAKASALRFALDRLDRDNAQREEYLSGIVAALTAARERFKVRALRIDRTDAILGYNDPADLLAIESIIRERRKGARAADLPASASFRTLCEWTTHFEGSPSLCREFKDLYGEDPDVIEERRSAARQLLSAATEILGADRRAIIVRSPGRLNVMGRHIDHQGGNCNLMTIGYETLLAVAPRDDDRVRLFNVERSRFPDREFSISEMVAGLPWDDWLSLVNSDKVREMVREAGGDWAQYVKAAVLRLQKKYPGTRLRGMDIIVSGNIPAAAGLSSSSSLVVGAAEATIALNRLETFPAQFVDLCGEGEWFVGTRGGAADHAAIRLGRKGTVIKVIFFDFAVQASVPFPDDYAMAVVDSGFRARKSGDAKDQFNHRIACYRLGFKLIRKLHPSFAPLLRHLRDVNVRTLGLPLSWIYRILLRLPERATRAELADLLPGEDLKPLWDSHREPGDGLYPIRGVVLFGLAECDRARLYADYLRSGRMADIGRLMKVSHDGDRVASWAGSGECRLYAAPTSNAYLQKLIEDLDSEEPGRVESAQLAWQPGSYACSLPVIDRMVDAAAATEGVAGAQLAGAGLGGCLMVLVRRDAVARLRANLETIPSGPDGAPPNVLVCRPIAGAGVLFGSDR